MQHTIMCLKVESAMFMQVSDCSKTEINCGKAVKKDLKMLKFVPDYFKTQEMRKKLLKIDICNNTCSWSA